MLRLYPACFIIGKDAASYDTVQVKMIQEPLVPGMQYGRKAQSAANIVPAELKKRFRYSLKQHRVDRLLVTEDNRVQFMRQRKDIVEIWHGQKLGLTVFDPPCLCQSLALRTMTVAAGVVGLLLETARIALLHMPAQIRGPAYFYCAQHLKMTTRQWVITPVALPGLPEYVGYFPSLCCFRTEGLRGQCHGAYFSGNLLISGVSRRSSGLFVAASFLLVTRR